MLYYDRIDFSAGIDVNKTCESKELDICHYCYFLNKDFEFQPDVCNGCQDVLLMSMNLSDIAILNLFLIIVVPLKKLVIVRSCSIIKNVDLTEKSRAL